MVKNYPHPWEEDLVSDKVSLQNIIILKIKMKRERPFETIPMPLRRMTNYCQNSSIIN